MSVTGAVLTLFVVGHMLGNLQLYLGPEALNHYARLLRVEPPLLWTIRLVLLACVLLHAATGTVLWFENRAARPEGYACFRTVKATIASRTMLYSGLIVAGFIVYHLLHLTFGRIEPRGYVMEEGNVYANVVQGFRDPFISGLYIVGQLLLYFHLSHGIQSLFQSLGWKGASYSGRIERLGSVVAFLVTAGNISMPVAVLVGLIR